MKKFLFVCLVCALTICCSLTSFTAFAAENDLQTGIRYTDAHAVSALSNEVFSYSSMNILESNFTPANCTNYTSNLSNSCGAVAGANVVGYYDRYIETLIPNYSSYHSVLKRYRQADSTYVPALINNLYTLMRTNIDDVGVSQSDFLSGLTQYVSNTGNHFAYSSIFSSSGLNYSAVKNEIDQGRVLLLFSAPSHLYKLTYSNNTATISSCNVTSAHIMVIYGYERISYTLINGQTRVDTYLSVCSNVPGYGQSYFSINSTSDIVDVITTNIY